LEENRLVLLYVPFVTKITICY